jgi:isochorismate pyruvate lyase
MREEIDKMRAEIDKLDNIIVDALVKRTDCVLEIVKYKTNEEEVRGCDRVKIVLDKVRNKAIQAGGHEEIVVEIYKKIIEVLTAIQLEILRQRQA